MADVGSVLSAGFALIKIDPRVAGRAVALRQVSRTQLPDATVWASAPVQAGVRSRAIRSAFRSAIRASA